MPIVRTAVPENHVPVAFHRALKLSVDLAAGKASVHVASHANADAAAAGAPVAWNWTVEIGLTAIAGAGNLGDRIEAALIGDGSPFAGGTIVADSSQSFDALKARKVAAMREACTAQILAGFTSSALGAAHTYPAQAQDQLNLAGSVLDSFMPDLPPDWTTPFACADQAGIWAKRAHTAAQIQQVGRAGKAAILAAIAINDALAVQIAEAGNPEQLETIRWPA